MHFAHTPQIKVLNVQKGKTGTTITLAIDSELFNGVSDSVEPFLTMRCVPVGKYFVDLHTTFEPCE